VTNLPILDVPASFDDLEPTKVAQATGSFGKRVLDCIFDTVRRGAHKFDLLVDMIAHATRIALASDRYQSKVPEPYWNSDNARRARTNFQQIDRSAGAAAESDSCCRGKRLRVSDRCSMARERARGLKYPFPSRFQWFRRQGSGLLAAANLKL
jgi:hypothetical protein